MSNPVLHYPNGRGRSETIRLMLAVAGVEWTEQHITSKEDLDNLKNAGLLLFEQVPLLQWDGINMVQSGPIVRHIARKYNLYGKPGEEFQVDMLSEGARDFLMPYMAIGFLDKTEEIKTKFLPRYMPIFEKILSTSKSGFLVGDGLTMADVCLLEVFLFVEEVTPQGFDGHPKCKQHFEKMKSQQRLAAYLNSSKRPALNKPEYCAMVRKIFDF